MFGGSLAAAELKDFADPDGGFTVQMPGQPTASTQKAGGGDMKLYVTEEESDAGSGACLVSVLVIPGAGEEANARLQQRLDGGVDGLLRSMSGKLVEVERIQLSDKYPGRFVRAKVKMGETDGVARARFFLVGDKLYQVMAVGTDSWIDGEDRSTFLRSFKLTKK